MKTLRLYSLAAVLALSFAPVAMADANLIVTANIQQIMRDSSAFKNIHEQVDAKQKSFQIDVSKKEEALQKEDQELSKQHSVLSKEAFETKLAAFRAKVTDAQKEAQTKKALLDNAFDRSLNEIQKTTADIIADMAKEKGFSVALPTSLILYADPKLDISSEVLERLNKKLPKLDVKFDAVESDSKSDAKSK